MTWSARTMGFVLAAAMAVLSCVDIPTGTDEVLSLELHPLPSPAVVAGDSLRDSLGVATPLRVTAFNFQGSPIAAPHVRFRPLDGRARVDSITGHVVGDSAGAMPARVQATVDIVRGTFAIPVTLRPDSVTGITLRDTLEYSLTDTTANVSDALIVKVVNGPAATGNAVPSFLVIFTLERPTDSLFARLVNDARVPTARDTTDAGGMAGRRVRIDVSRLVSPMDSVGVLANVRYRGQHIGGSPMRLVLTLRPR